MPADAVSVQWCEKAEAEQRAGQLEREREGERQRGREEINVITARRRSSACGRLRMRAGGWCSAGGASSKKSKLDAKHISVLGVEM